MLTVEVDPGYQFTDQEKVDNDKLNLLGRPTIDIDGGVDALQAEAGPWFVAANASSVVNAYVGQLQAAEQDPTGPISDGTVVVFKIPATLTNTAASTFQLKGSTGASLVGASAIQRRGRAVLVGELVAGQYIELRWDGTFWQLVTVTGCENPSEIAVGPVWWGTNDASTGTAFQMRMTPGLTASLIGAGARVGFVVPVTNTGTTTLQLKDGAGTNVGSALQIQRVNRLGGLVGVDAGELVAGAVVEVIHTGSTWQLVTDMVDDLPLTVNGLTATLNGGTPNTKVDVAADEVVVQRATAGTSGRIVTTVSGTVDITVNGANGLDTGAAANDTWYYLYVIFKPDPAGVALLLSTSATNPALPAGYTHRARVGVVRRDSGGAFIPFYQSQRRVWVRPTQIFTGKTASASNVYQSLSGADATAFQAIVPPIAKVCAGVMGSSVVSSSMNMVMAGDANGLGAVYHQTEQGENATYDGMSESCNFEVPVASGPNVFWKDMSAAPAAQSVLKIVGWSL